MKISPRARRLAENYLLSEVDWQKIFDFQHGCCAICKRKLKKANTDHDHETGEVRGILCARCNRALGRFGDSAVLIQAALEYLSNFPAVGALGRHHFGLPGRIGTKKRRRLIQQLKKEGKLT